MRSSIALAVVVFASLLRALQALAHHGELEGSLYETEGLIIVEGELTGVLWRNPHVRFMLRGRSSTGEEKLWELESASVNRLSRFNLTVDDFALGDHVKAAGYSSRRNRDSLGLTNLLLADGREYVSGRGSELRWGTERIASVREEDELDLDEAAVGEARRAADGIFRVWSSTSIGEYRRRYEDYAHLATATARIDRAAYDRARDDPELRCRQGMPMTMFDPMNMEITRDGPDRIMLRLESYDVERTIHMGGDQSLSGIPTPSPLGYSVGRWDEGALTIRTSYVSWPYFDIGGTPLSDRVEFIERFSLTEDESRLNYTLTTLDPVMFTGPVVSTRYWWWNPGQQLRSYDCTDQWEE